ncbi:MAG: PKD domain-containing protein [Bacteroidales bacterium]|nr:PKD domain-containing protein [Bacteroidales bacterium]MDT8430413.1 PKD domain-containing protein [Bacteroidales bacterium]
MQKSAHYSTVVATFFLALFLSPGSVVAAQGDPIGFSLSGASVTEKDTFTIALNAETLLTGREVYAYRFHITYSPAYFEYLGTGGAGPVLSGWDAPVENSMNAGTLVLAGAGAQPLSGNGEMIYLRFRSLRSGNAWISFNTTGSYLNEGNPSSAYVNGLVSAAALSVPNISPDNAQLYIGGEVKMTVSGGEAPYTYAVSNPLVAQVTGGDTVRATGPGTTRVSVTDGKGEVSVTTGVFDVRAIRMDMEEVSVWPADTFYVPVRLEIAPGTSVYSGRFELAHSGNLTGLQGDILQGDFPVILSNNAKSGRMTVSFASSTGITGNGLLCYLAFRGNSSGNQFIRFENMRFNESLLAWTTQSNYYINVRALPTLYMSPNSGTLMWGEQVKLNVSNGTAPYTYKVSDPEIASVDIQGNLTAITGGRVQVTATDVNGATMTSGVFTVTDNRVTIYDAEGVLDAETRVPILTSSLPQGKAVYSYLATASFDNTYLQFVRTESAGNNGLVQASLSGNTIEMAGALSQGVSSGVLGYLVFNIRTALPINSTTTVNMLSFSANENSLVSSLKNGTVRRVEQTSYRPVAIAGLDFSLQEGTAGQLDGTASFDLDDDPLTYAWSAPAGILLDDPASPTAGFIAPYVEEDTEFIFTLVVNDGTNDSDPAEVRVTVLQVNYPPEANAGPDANYVEGSSVSLNGSLSFDPDGDALSYTWQALDGIVLFNANSVRPSFILPQVAQNTAYRFTLVVNDGAVNSAKDTVVITSVNVNKKPVAFAGGDFRVDENAQAALDGSLSYDADNDPLTYRWTAPPEVILSSASVAAPTFTAPAVIRDSVLRFELVVNDGSRDSDPDAVLVTVVNLDILNTATHITGVALVDMDSAVIDTTAATVMLHVPYGTDIRSLSPQFTLSEGAMLQPGNGSMQNFSVPVYYRVTAEDGITSRLWKVEVFSGEISVARTLEPGWNWLSLNVAPQDRDINTLFGGLALGEMDYLKSTSYSSVYYNATGWFGNLSVFPQHRVLRFRKGTGEQLVVAGREINPAITPVPVTEGWNDLPYLLRTNALPGAALDPATLPGGEVLLKGASGASVYYESSGWTGEIDSLRVLHGYRIHVASAGNLYYDPAASAKKAATAKAGNAGVDTKKNTATATGNAGADTQKKSGTATVADRQALFTAYGLAPHAYEYSATMIAEAVSADGYPATREGDVLLALGGTATRGVAPASYVPALGRYIFIMSIYAHNEGVPVTFSIHREGEEGTVQADLSLNFSQDEIIGAAYDPQALVISDLYLGAGNAVRNRLEVYPNPVTDQLFLRAPAEVREIRMYDMSGKQVVHTFPLVSHITIDVHRLEQGIYTLEAVTGDEVLVRKIVKTSR